MFSGEMARPERPQRPDLTDETVQNLGVVTPLAETDAGANVRLRHAPGEEISTVGSTSGLWIDLVALDREGGMKWRVMVELGGVEGTVELYEVSADGSATTEYSAETLGLSIAVNCGRESDPGRAATLPGPGTGRGALPQPPSL